MPGEDDGWEPFDDEETKLDEVPPVPEAVPETAVTGSYKTLSGFEAAAAREISGARDRLYGRDEVFCGLKIWLAEVQKQQPLVATYWHDAFRKWFSQNEERVQAAMRKLSERR